jgi:hypothetical protein
MAFYQQIRKNSHIVREAKKDASDAKVASNNALRSKWVDTNWTPLKELLEDEIACRSDQGAFSVIVEVSTKSFENMCDSPLFKTDTIWWSIRGFIKLISKSGEEDHNILNQFESISWANKGFLDGFVIKHEVDERHGVEKVVFDISWNH